MEYEITKHSMGGIFSDPETAFAAANQEAAQRGRHGWTMVNGSTSMDQYGAWTIFMFWRREVSPPE
jgi:hypothetical protein